MTPQQWLRLRRHFEDLCALPEAEHARQLEALDEDPELLTKLRAMLAADRSRRLRTCALQQAPALHQLAAADPVPTGATNRVGERLGPWQLLAAIGCGGMAQVYRARRDDGRYQSEVAIKIVSRALDSGRFLRERAILARLRHPGIAHLLDGGECADGLPYLVLEHVDGLAIDQHCQRMAVPALQRVALVAKAAQATAYAHAHAVLHRDLKPDNILVDASGTVKLLDFGVAKLLDEQGDVDSTCARYFTPRYAAPEQIAGETATTATDVFALAVVLFELLTGRHPYASDVQTLAHGVLTGEPLSLRQALRKSSATGYGRTWRRRQSTTHGDAAADARAPMPMIANGLDLLGADRQGDLEAVLARALARLPAHRFASMEAFANELQRVLDDRPVRTRVTGPGERLWRWTRHHRVAAAGIAMGLLCLLTGLGLALWQAHEAHVQRDMAVAEAQRSQRVADFLATIFRAPNPARSRGEELTARDLLDHSRERIAIELADDALLRQRLQSVIADTYRSLGEYDQAEQLLRDALAATEQASAPLLLELGWLHAYQGRHDEAAEQLHHAANAARDSDDEATLITALTRSATPLINLGRTEDAQAAVVEALQHLDRRQPRDHEKEAVLRDLLASIAYMRGDLDRAERLYREVLETRLKLHGPHHTGVAVVQGSLGTVALRRGDPQRAEQAYRAAIAGHRAHFGIDNDQVASALRALAMALRRQQRLDDALATVREALAIQTAWGGDRHPLSIDLQLDLLELVLELNHPHRDALLASQASIRDLPADAPQSCRLQRLVRQAPDWQDDMESGPDTGC